MSDHRYESAVAGDMISTWRAVFERQRAFAEHAFGQLDDERFFAVVAPGLNSVAVIARHMGGNMLSRWTDFLTTDGEKESRDRDAELEAFPEEMSAEERATTRAQIMDLWSRGWAALSAALDELTDADLGKQVTIRGVPHAVHAALARQLDDYAFHVGQINIIARQLVGTE
ncbi:MAG: DUF1572 family protein, partial [Phycisphaerales bacterium]|nr:DUF1572 family protein [Phycisphaerales bacterium]